VAVQTRTSCMGISGTTIMTEEELLELQARTERLERWRRRGKILMYSPVMGFYGCAVGGLISWLGGGGLATSSQQQSKLNLWDIPFMASAIFLLCSVVIVPVGIIIRGGSARRIEWCFQHVRPDDLPPWPPPLIGERFGRYIVHECSENRLRLSLKYRWIQGLVRCFISIVILVFCSALLFMAISSGTIWGSIATPVICLVMSGGIGWTLSPFMREWIVAKKAPENYCLVNQIVCYFKSQSRTVETSEITGFCVRKSDTFISDPRTVYMMTNLPNNSIRKKIQLHFARRILESIPPSKPPRFSARIRKEIEYLTHQAFELSGIGVGSYADWQIRRLLGAISKILPEAPEKIVIFGSSLDDETGE